ncbi:MAG: succinyldiaminopimelate transaminase [Sulfurimonas sp.]|uniref:succinyldiaminopimelate transaminase n=1 Tax=Sulfurimonas sp. TaxID=2022749 RepID=UPI00262561DC|nr:succinyldiaminopimelate transaminase [Sulfurimonas sp.]MCW8894862.1 succinyldiaminopimelate transaminase [Sulfurimonas sp.]MCW8953728.1 succinyldiaminopimelate transaminase [Sulfurimonas sp.]MCW9067179.1 succinyldiaminopimelate transaminase [Sulfurimonas sp.]
MNFEPYPFEKLNNLLKDVVPSKNYEPSVLTIGEPQFETPDFIQKALSDNAALLKKYPKTTGEDELRVAQRNFISKRFGVDLSDEQIIPTFGTREVLFNFPQFLLFNKQKPTIAYTNPFYQIYEGAAIASRAKTIHLNLNEKNNFKPEINEEELSTCDLVILNFPNNPTTSTLTLDELGVWVLLALKHDFVLLNDECYSEIYTNEPIPSLLEASVHVKNTDFKNILVINSISKRSSAPGLRSGFIAGDENILKEYMKYRTYIGCASPLPLQSAAAAAWNDEEHVKTARETYKNNFKIAKEILGVEIPSATFYLWLKVPNPIEFTKKLFLEFNVKVLPGEYLARENEQGINPGKEFIRIALVESEEKTKNALQRIKECLDER